MPSEVTSSTAYLQFSRTAWRKNFWTLKRPGIVIFKVFFSSCCPILNLTEDIEAVLCPASSKIRAIKSTVVDFPLVPVTPITVNFREGNPNTTAPKNARR